MVVVSGQVWVAPFPEAAAASPVVCQSATNLADSYEISWLGVTENAMCIAICCKEAESTGTVESEMHHHRT